MDFNRGSETQYTDWAHRNAQEGAIHASTSLFPLKDGGYSFIN